MYFVKYTFKLCQEMKNRFLGQVFDTTKLRIL